MSTTNLPTYISSSDLRDVYPNIKRYDLKVPVYDFTGTDGLWETHSVGKVNAVFINGRKCYDSASLTNDYDYYYTQGNDKLQIRLDTSNINDFTIEVGEDWTTKVADISYKASRLLDSLLDVNMPSNQWKNTEQSFDYIIIRTTAQIAAYMFISAHEPNNEDALTLRQEFIDAIERINSGKIKLHFQKTSDSSHGTIKVINKSTDTELVPVDLRGKYIGTYYDKIKVKVTTTGTIGQATYSVYTKTNDKLGIAEAHQAITDEIINGDYQTLTSGLMIRFGAQTSLSGITNPMNATATFNDMYEIEVFGQGESAEDGQMIKSVDALRI